MSILKRISGFLFGLVAIGLSVFSVYYVMTRKPHILNYKKIGDSYSVSYDFSKNNKYNKDTYRKGQLLDIVIPEKHNGKPVTEIEATGFKGCGRLQSITIPSSVTIINNYSFANCLNLKKVIMDDGVTVISNYAFEDCYNLTEINLSSSLTEVRRDAFKECTNLKNVYYNSNVNDWMNINFIVNYSNPSFYAQNFYFLDNNGTVNYNEKKYSIVEEVTIPGSIEEIGYNFIGMKNLNKVTISSGVKEIGQDAFYNCESLHEIIIPESVEYIDGGAFYNCNSLSEITIPNCKEYGYNVFEKCITLKKVTLNNVVELSPSIFKNCKSLEEVVLDGSFKEIPSYCFDGCEQLKKVEYPYSVRSIDSFAFNGCTGLEELDIHEGIKKIGVGVFNDCTSIKELVMPNSLQEFDYSYAPFDGNDYVVKNGTFENCTCIIRWKNNPNLKKITTIFYNYKAKYIFIPKSVNGIYDAAFSNFETLTDIYFMASSEEMEEIEMGVNNRYYLNATKYYYSEEEPENKKFKWHFDTDGKTPIKWAEE